MRVSVETTVRAPREVVCATLADHESWPATFPATISAVRLVSRDGPRVVVEVAHREGRVVNELVLDCPARIELREVKRRYVARFDNEFTTVGAATRCRVVADLRFLGWARLLRPVLRPVVRRQIERFTLEPLRRAAEGRAAEGWAADGGETGDGRAADGG